MPALSETLSVGQAGSAEWVIGWRYHSVRYLCDRVVSGARFLSGSVFECDIAHLDLWQYCVCCIRSGVTQCTFFLVLSTCALEVMCQCGLRAVIWSHIGILMRPLSA